nr:hypothetical protein [Tanacetum cinerariifolium]
MFKTTEYLLRMKQVRKASKQDFILKQHPKGLGEGYGMALEVPDGPSGSSSSSNSESDDEIKDISSDEGRSEADDTEKADAEKVEANKAKEEKAGEEQHVDGQGGNEQARDVQAKVHVYGTLTEKLAAILISSGLTLPFAKYGNQFINDNHDVSINEVSKDPAKIKVQSMVEVPVCQENPIDQTPSLVDIVVTMILEKTTQPPQSRIKTKVLLKNSLEECFTKYVPDFDKIKQEKATKQNMPKYSTKPFDDASLKEYDLNDKLIKLMMKSKSYNKHTVHMKLDEALMDSFLIDENDMDKQLDNHPSQKKRHHDDQDPPADVDKETKKRKKKDSDASSSKKSKDKEGHQRDIVTFDDLIGSTIDFTKFAKNCLKKDKLMKVGLEEPAFKLLKGNYRNYIKLEYNMDQCYLALTDQIDWANLEGDKCPYDLSKPLPLQGPPGRTTIPVGFFFNKYLKYLKT